MTSMQCYRTCSESCETKHHGNSSLAHKVSDMVGKALHGGNNHQAYPHHHNSNQSLYHHNQTLPAHYYSDNQPPCHGQTLQAHHQQMGQYGGGAVVLTPALGGAGGYGHHGHGYSSACSSTGQYEIRKVRSHSHRRTNKHHDGNRSCSDASSGSDSD